jgi:hypothetical protein
MPTAEQEAELDDAMRRWQGLDLVTGIPLAHADGGVGRR